MKKRQVSEGSQVFYRMEPAALAILGHMSAHSFATGPVTAEPFISPLGFTMTPALSEEAGSEVTWTPKEQHRKFPRQTKHTFEVNVDTILSSPSLSLSNNYGRSD